MNNGHFYNPSQGIVTLQEMISAMSSFVSEEPEGVYRLVIGTDSQLKHSNGHTECDFVTAIVIHRAGRGARYFWRKEKIAKRFVLREKIYTETLRSLETANTLIPTLQSAISPAQYDLEIHIDVGNIGSTREMIKEVVGMVSGSGYVAKTKPDSWAASSVADKHT